MLTEAGGKPDTPASLALALSEESGRLGVDPLKVASSVPNGPENAVFDLAATIQDSDGSGPLAPSMVELKWTERLVGDYDQNGEVNISDLSPLSPHWNLAVEYDSPALHGGFGKWPSEDPDGAGALNWRRSRVDGDLNGLITISDVSPIAKYWKNMLTGYRVYLKRPAESDFSAMGLDPDTSVSIAHPTPAASSPVRYFFDVTAAVQTPGAYQFFVVPFGAGQEGPPSPILTVDTSLATTNLAPTAAVTADPATGIDPLTVTFDASGSYDVDGSIAAYRWDFESDGTWDTGWETSPSVQREYLCPDSFTVTVEAQDNQSATSSATTEVEVRSSSWTLGVPLETLIYINAFDLDDSGNIYLLGADGTSQVIYEYFIAKYSPAGDQLWLRKLVSSGDELGFGAHSISCGSHNILVSGGAKTSSFEEGGHGDGLCFAVSPEGELLWERRIDNGAYDQLWVKTHFSNGDALLQANVVTGSFDLGSRYYIRMTPAGQVVWQRELLNEDGVNEFDGDFNDARRMETGPDGTIIFEWPDGFALLDGELEPRWSKDWGIDPDLFALPNGAFGAAARFSWGSSLMRLTNSGDVSSGIRIGESSGTRFGMVHAFGLSDGSVVMHGSLGDNSGFLGDTVVKVLADDSIATVFSDKANLQSRQFEEWSEFQTFSGYAYLKADTSYGFAHPPFSWVPESVPTTDVNVFQPVDYAISTRDREDEQTFSVSRLSLIPANIEKLRERQAGDEVRFYANPLGCLGHSP